MWKNNWPGNGKKLLHANLFPALFFGGKIIDVARGNNLGPTFKTMDRAEFKEGLFTNIKSVDLRAKTYQNMGKLNSLLKRYVNKVAEFQGDRLGKKHIQSHQINQRALELVIPHKGNPAQNQVIKELIEYGKSKNVIVKPIIY